MKSLVSGASAALAMLAGGAAEAQEPGRKFLSHEELKALMSRVRTVRFSGPAMGTSTYEQDGSMSAVWVGGGDRGRWRIDDDQLCTRFATIYRGAESCYRLQRNGENTFTMFWNDTVWATWEVQP